MRAITIEGESWVKCQVFSMDDNTNLFMWPLGTGSTILKVICNKPFAARLLGENAYLLNIEFFSWGLINLIKILFEKSLLDSVVTVNDYCKIKTNRPK